MRPLPFFLLLLTSITAAPLLAQSPIPLWPNGAPGALGNEPTDIPTITVYSSDNVKAGSPAMIVFPGGGYGGLAGHEGKDYALWFNQQGIKGFVVRYRLGSKGYRHPSMLHDAARAVRYVRANADQLKINPDQIGIIGSSAGGHLASTLLTHFDPGNSMAADPVDRQSSRPTLGILCYPVISMGPNTHHGSRNNLLGSNQTPELLRYLSNELQVTPNTPPTFLWHTVEDRVVKVENSLEFAVALQENKVPYALHIYQKGRHGLGLASRPPFNNPHPWAADCLVFLKTQGFTK